MEPDEVEDVLRVTATVLGFPSRPEEFCSSSYRLPMMGVLRKNTKATFFHLIHSSGVSGVTLPGSNQEPLIGLKVRADLSNVTNRLIFLVLKYTL